jgi:hypothetical protein
MAIPNVTEKRAADAQKKNIEIYQSAIASGASEEEALAAVKGSGYGSVTPRLDRMAYDEEQRQERLKSERAAAPPVKKDLRVQQLIRSFKGQAPLAETPEQFAAQINTSAGYGENSAMFTPAGKARAIESAVAAGLSPVQAQAQIDAATASILRDVGERARIVKGLTSPMIPISGAEGLTPTSKAAPATTTKPFELMGPPESAKSPSRKPKPQDIVDPETALPETAAELIKSLAGDISTKDVAEVSRPASAVAQTAKQLKDTNALRKLNIAAIMQAVKYPVTNTAGVSRFAPIAAQLARTASAATRLAPALTGLSRASKPLQVIDPILQAFRYQTDEDFRQKMIDETLAANEKGLGYTVGRAAFKANPLSPFANPVPVLAATMEAPLEARNRLLGAKGELEAQQFNLRLSERREDQRKKIRRSLISDEEFLALPREEKIAVDMEASKLLRELRDKSKKAKTNQ